MSTTRSEDSPDDNWLTNWKLLRALWPDWTPSDEEARTLWWASFDKPHAKTGPQTVNHAALRAAIVAVKETSLHRSPVFHLIADRYREEKWRRWTRSPEGSIGRRAKDERELLKEEAAYRLERVREWPPDRLRLAMEAVAKRMPTFKCKTDNPECWSDFYVVCLICADKDLEGHFVKLPGEGGLD